MKKVLLISMPWQSIVTPSVALGTLKSILERKGIQCDCCYLNIKFGEKIGDTLYSKVADNRFLDGERLFSPFVFSNENDDRAILPHKRYWIYSLPPEAQNKVLTQAEYEYIHRIIPDFLDECLREIPWDEYDIIGFTTVFEQNLSSLALSKRLKKLYPSKVIIFGGGNCDGEMGPTLHKKFDWIDYVVVGEADSNLVPLIHAIRNGRSVKDILGIAYRGKSGETIFTGYSTPVQNMDSIPIPEYDDYFNTLKLSSLKLNPQVYFESSRGCWWGQKHLCTFCGMNQSGINFRVKSARRVLKEILKLLHKYKVSTLLATDTILPMQFIKELFPLLIHAQDKYDFEIYYETKSNLTKEQIQTMAAAGVTSVQPGIESFNDHILKLMNKGCIGIRQIQTLKWLMEFKIRIQYGIIHSFPHEKADDYIEMLHTMSFITHIYPPNYCTSMQMHRFSPYFNYPDRYSIKNIRPFIGYWRIYPFSQDDVSKIVYMFDFDIDNSDPDLPEAREACIRYIKEWQKNWKPDLLTFRRGPGFIKIHDRRVNKDKLRTLDKNESKIYSFCDTYHSYDRIVREFDGNISEREISEILESFVEDRLMYKDSNNRFISLAILK